MVVAMIYGSKGEILKLSTVVNNYLFSEARRIEILALNTIYIDEDVHRVGDEVELIIIAPKWVVIGTRKINLDGKEGSPLSEPVAKNKKVGIPGLPGGPGGRFFGVGVEFIDGDSLEITANGGKGGCGQIGAPGDTGSSGRDAQLPTPNYAWLFTGDGFTDFEFNYEQVEDQKFTMPLLVDMRVEIAYKIYGKRGGAGSKGSDGGVGGEGGYAGCVMLYPENSGIIISAENGCRGPAGSGGDGGLGGWNGDDIIGVVTGSALVVPITGFSREWMKADTITNGRAASGSKGANGVNDSGILSASGSSQYAEPEEYLNSMKSYLKEFEYNFVRSHKLKYFVTYLQDSAIPKVWR